MKKFIIKLVCEATEKNDKFKGKVLTFYKGKNNSSSEDVDRIAIFAKFYGYTTKAGAMRGFKSALELAEIETANGYWKDSVEILEIETA